MKTSFKKTIAALAALTLVCGVVPSMPFADVISNMGITASATIYSCNCFDFESSTGALTLKGNVELTDITTFPLKDKVTSINAQIGTVFPENSNSMFYNYSNCKSMDFKNVDTRNVTDMSRMFFGCFRLSELDLSSFDTSNVTCMEGMFKSCEELAILDLSSFDTSKVTDMERMFSFCSSLKSLDLSRFDTSNFTDISCMFEGCYKLSEIYCDESSYNSFILKGELSSKVVRKGNYVSKSALSEIVSKYEPEKLVFCSDVPESYTTGEVEITGSSYKGYYDKFSASLYICGNDGKKIEASADCSEYFKGMTSLKSIDLSGLDTSNVSSMSGMFEDCTSLKCIDMSKVDTSKVKDFSKMFYGASSLEKANLKGLVTESGEDLWNMFAFCFTLKSIDMTGWNTSNVTNMCGTFGFCTELESVDVSGFDTRNVINMASMFSGSSKITALDLSNFDTSSVTSMNSMFLLCKSLKYIDVSGFDIYTGSPDIQNMFAFATVEKIACTTKEYNKYVSDGSLRNEAVRVDNLCTSSAEFSGNTMSLGGSISVNFYVPFKNIPMEQLQKSYVEFTVNGKTQTAKFDANKKNSDKTKYGFTCVLNSVSMADNIYAKLVYFDEYGIQHTTETTYAAQTYLDTAIAKSTNTKMVALAKSIYDYGYYMQKYLAKTNGWTIGTDHVGMAKSYTSATAYSNKKSTYVSELSAYQKTQSLKADISKINYSLSLDSNTSINVKITPATGYTGSITATVDGESVKLTKQSDGRYAFSIANIPAHELATMHTVSIKTAKGTSTYKVSALSFTYDCLNSKTANAERDNAACALYEYYKAAKAYIG